MTILVTGAGLIGSWIAHELVELGERPVLMDVTPRPEYIASAVDLSKVTIVKGDVLDLPGLLKIIEENNVDRIIHTAAILSGVQRERPLDIVKVNILGTAHMFEAARLLGLKRVAFASSSTVYVGAFGALQGKLSTEEFDLRFLRDRPRPFYATTKVADEYLAFNYRDLFGIDFVGLRYAGAFGPWPGPVSALTGAALDLMIRKALAGEPVTVVEPIYWRGGEEFIYVKDVARGSVLACLAPEVPSRIYNLGMGAMYRLEEMAEMVRALVPGARITIQPEEVGDVGATPLVRTDPNDVSLAKRELGFEARYSMQEALTDYVAWMRQLNK